MGTEMLPALLLHYCRIIKHAVAADEAEAQREAKADHSYQLPHKNSHLVRQQQRAEEPVPHSTTPIQVPGEAAAVKALLDLWSRLGLSSANLVTLFNESSQKVRKLEAKTPALCLVTQRLSRTCYSNELRARKASKQYWVPDLLGELQYNPEFSYSDFIQM